MTDWACTGRVRCGCSRGASVVLWGHIWYQGRADCWGLTCLCVTGSLGSLVVQQGEPGASSCWLCSLALGSSGWLRAQGHISGALERSRSGGLVWLCTCRNRALLGSFVLLPDQLQHTMPECSGPHSCPGFISDCCLQLGASEGRGWLRRRTRRRCLCCVPRAAGSMAALGPTACAPCAIRSSCRGSRAVTG